MGKYVAICGLLAAAWFALPAPNQQSKELKIPAELVAIAQQTKAGGLFEFEMDAAGTVLGFSCEIAPSSVPKACVDAAEKAAPGGKVTGAEKEVMAGVTYFEVLKEIDGRSIEILLTPDGKVAGREDELKLADVPKNVLDAANAAVPAGEVVAVEKVTGPEALGATEHHVKKKVEGEILRISVLESGKVGRVLRKLRAEVKIPRG